MADVTVTPGYLEVGDLAGLDLDDVAEDLTVAGSDVGIITPQEPVGWEGPNDPDNHTPGKPLKGRYLALRVTENGSQTDTVLTVLAGAQGGTPANQAAYGDLTSSAFGDGEVRFVQVELARHLQADGTVRLTVDGTTGGSLEVAALVLNKAS